MISDAAYARKREREYLLAFLKRGGVLIREEIGGVVGVRWGRANRNGPSFETGACERLLTRGCTIDGVPHGLVRPADGSERTYRLAGIHDPA